LHNRYRTVEAMDTDTGELYDDVLPPDEEHAADQTGEADDPMVAVKGERSDAVAGDDEEDASSGQDPQEMKPSVPPQSESFFDRSPLPSSENDKNGEPDRGIPELDEPVDEPFEEEPSATSPTPGVAEDVKPSVSDRGRSVIVEYIDPPPKSPMSDDIRVNRKKKTIPFACLVSFSFRSILARNSYLIFFRLPRDVPLESV
jgi:hypothetical protein